MFIVNPYHLTEKQAAVYTRLRVKELRSQAVPYLQYHDNSPRYYKKSDLDRLIHANIKGRSRQRCA